MLRYICIHKLLNFKKMNKPIIIALIAILVLMILLPITALSQEKKVQLKTIKMVDGKKVVNDTTFTVKDGEDKTDIIKTLSWVSDEDSASIITIDIEIDSDNDGYHKVIILKSGKDGDFSWTHHGGKKYNYLFKTDELKDCEHAIHLIDELDFEFDESKLKEIEIQLAMHRNKLHAMRIELDGEKLLLDGEKILILSEIDELKELKELQHLDEIIELKHLRGIKELKNIEIIVPEIPEVSYFPSHNEFYFDRHHRHNNVSDKELRNAGIKNKPNKLEINDYDLTIDDGIVKLDFSLVGEGSPKVTVFNYFGEKVFSGKPTLMNGKYTIMIDLSAKQNGVYYLQVSQKKSSFTKKLRLH